jgi:ABC-type multidrug transport system fused ATPase/permease subunit
VLGLADTEIRVSEVPPNVAAETSPARDGARSSSGGPALSQATSAPADRPALEDLASIESEAATIRFRPGTVGAETADAVAAAAERARRRLAGLGSEATGVRPQICLVDPFPDPQRPGEMVASGTIIDEEQAEIWMVVTPESPPEPVERPLALLFGASLPAAGELSLLLEGFGLYAAETEAPDDQLRGEKLPSLADAGGQLRPAMALSFVRFLVAERGEEELRRLLAEAQPGRVDTTAREVFGRTLSELEASWRAGLAEPGPGPHQGTGFLRMVRPLLRVHTRRVVEMLLTMVLGLAFTVAFPFAFRRLIDTAIPSGSFSQVAAILAVVASAFVVSFLAELRRTYLSAYVSAAVARDLRERMFDTLQGLSIGWFSRHQEGDITARFYSDVTTVETGLSRVLADGLSQVLSIVVSAVILLTLNFWLGLIVFAGAPVVLVVYRQMSAGAERRSLEVQGQTGALMAMSSENYGAQGVVKAFALEDRERARFTRASVGLFTAQTRLELFGGLFALSVSVVTTVLRLAVLGLGAWMVLRGHFSVGGLVAFMGVMSGVLGPITVLTEVGRRIQASTGALVRMNELLSAVPEITDPRGAEPLPPLEREIRLDGVSFSYSPERKTLDHVTATIPAGARVAFVGPTGAGKSSVLRLVMRFYDPVDGAVRFDGRDIRTVTVTSLRDQMGVVFQDTFLFDATIGENIALGRPGATDAEIEAAARAAELHDFIETLPQRYATPVGERGALLSGGQRQRLAIARALVREPRILLLDEATSALDPRTERLIAETLDRVGAGRTTIAITHRLTSIISYDRIFVIVDGKLVEAGTHDELVQKGGVYAGLWAEQIGAPIRTEAPFDAVAALARIPLFAPLTAEQLASVARRLRPADLAPGDTLREGGGRLAIVRRGRPVVLGRGIGGSLVPVTQLSPGDAFGVGALLEGDTGSELKADSPVSLLVLDDEAIVGLSAEFPAVAEALEGTGTRAPRPTGGRRLSRMTSSGLRLTQ